MDLKRFRRMDGGSGTKDWVHGQKFRKEKGASASGEEGTEAQDSVLMEFGGGEGFSTGKLSVYRRWGLWI